LSRADGLNEHDVHAEGVEDAHRVEGGKGESSGVAARRHRSDEDPGSTPVSAIRIRSPSTAPPVYGDVGSTATTPTFDPDSGTFERVG